MAKKTPTVSVELTATQFAALDYAVSVRLLELTRDFAAMSRRNLTVASQDEIDATKVQAATLAAELADLQNAAATFTKAREDVRRFIGAEGAP